MGKKSGKSAVVEDMDDDLELIEDDEDEAPKTKKKSTKKSAPASKKEPKSADSDGGLGAAWLAEHVNEELGTDYTAANMRVILRKMAADGELEREVGTDRARYSFSGEKDPTVRAVLKRVKSGEADQAKKERLAAARGGSKKATAEVEEDEAPAKKSTKKNKTKVSEEDEAPAKPVRRKRNAE